MPTRSQTAGNKSIMDDSTSSQPTISSMLFSSTDKKNKKPPTTSTIKKGNASSSSTSSSKQSATTANDDELEKMSDHDLLLTLVQDLRQLSAKFDNMNMMMASFDERIKKQEEKCNNNTKEIESYKNQLNKLEEEVESIRVQDTVIHKQEEKIEKMEFLLEDLYCKVNEPNVIVKGLQTNKSIPIQEQINKIFYNLGERQKPRINSVKFLGKTNKVLVRFDNSYSKTVLHKNAKHLHSRGIGFEDDLPPQMRKDRNLLLQKRREIIDNGTSTSIKVLRRALLIDDKDYYTLDRKTGEISRVPPRPSLPRPSA
jgi:hypothetical protein